MQIYTLYLLVQQPDNELTSYQGLQPWAKSSSVHGSSIHYHILHCNLILERIDMQIHLTMQQHLIYLPTLGSCVQTDQFHVQGISLN